MNVIVNDLLVNYTRQGSGTPLVLLHGWGDHLETFDEITRKLEKDHTIIRLDLPGFGKSQAPTSAWGLEQYAVHVGTFLQKINCKPEAIVGHSNGGAIAIYGLANGQLKAKKLILLSSAGIRSIGKGRKFAWKLLAKAGKAATGVLPPDARASLRAKLYQSAGSDLLVAPNMEATFKRIVSEDVQTDAALLRLPTLIMNGREDTATPPVFAETFHRIVDNSKLILVDDAGHFLHQQYPDKVSSAVKDFLAS